MVLSRNELPELRDLDFVSLRHINVEENPRLQFDQNVFQATPSALTSMYMSNIDLGILEPSVFSHLELLEIVSLEDIKLVELNEFAINPSGQTLLQVLATTYTTIMRDAITGKP